MDSLSAFAMGQANQGKESMVFDWVKAAQIIKEGNHKNARAGLRGDWEYTGGDILEDGKIPEDNYTYLSSTWAVPELEIEGEVQACYVMQSQRKEWGSRTFWPDEAKSILGL